MTRQLIIGFTGKQEAGKSTAARYLRARYGFEGSNLTDPMDEMLVPLLRRMKVPDAEIARRLSGDMKNVAIPGFDWLTGRKLKQALGLEFRDVVSRPAAEGGTDRGLFHDLWKMDNERHAFIVHEQVRYAHEAALIRRDGGYVYEIVDPDEKREDDHESERIGFEVDARVMNPKTGLDTLHAALDVLMAPLVNDVERIVVKHGEDEPLAAFDDEIDAMLNTHGEEIRTLGDRMDAEGGEMSEVLDDVASEIKGHLGAKAANTADDDQAAYAVDAAERWVTDNVSNSTSDRRIAATYALLGVDGARQRLGVKP